MINHLLRIAQGLGNVIDLPGSSVRDALAMRNPFDQYLTPFGDQNRTSGRDLLRHHGLVGKRDTWGNFAGGLAAETLLDPTNLIGAGFLGNALKRQGQIAKGRHLISQLDPLTSGFSPEIIRLMTGKKVNPLLEAAQAPWRNGLSDAERFAIESWSGGTGHGAIQAVEHGGPIARGEGAFSPMRSFNDEMVPDYVHKYYADHKWNSATKRRDRPSDLLPINDYTKRLGPSKRIPYYTPDNVKRFLNEPLESAIGRAKIPHDTEVVRIASDGPHLSQVGVIHHPEYFATSASKDPNMSMYGRNQDPATALLNVVVPSGQKGAHIEGLSKYGAHESEVLFKRPSLRVIAKRELPVVSSNNGLTWHRGRGLNDYRPRPYGGKSGSATDDVLSGIVPGQITKGVQPNYLVEMVHPSYKTPLSETISTPGLGAGLAAYNTVARNRRGRK